MHTSLMDKVAIVTGASSGIGESTARAFAREGAQVVLAARREQRLKIIAEEIQEAGGRALPVQTDLTRREDITDLIQTTIREFGRIDILANIAGWGKYDWIEDFEPEELRNQYEVNILGLAELTRQVVPYMKEQRSGHIINMSSYASRISVPPLTVYASTKYAIEGFTDGIRRELRPWGIIVSRVHPSAVTGTEFNKKAGQRGGIHYKSVPIGRITREHLAEILVKLVEHPKRAVFVSRLYDVPVFINRRFPGVIDLFFDFWVRSKRPELSRLPKIAPKNMKLAAGLMGVGFGAVLTAWVLTSRSKRG